MVKVIETTSGIYQGVEKNNHVEFRGIPYGHARRFKRAQEYQVEDPDKFHFATRLGTQAMQDDALSNDHPGIHFGENCLNLDISTPNVEGNNPIVIEFYGGSFLHGGTYNKQMVWLNDQNIVHVMPNYRLGLFGWGVVRGGDTNVGLSDQLMSIKWVIDNAKNIGGDVNNITLLGLSAGAKSIAALMASNSPIVDKVKKVVLFSGSLQTIRDMKTQTEVSARFCSDNRISSSAELFNLTDDGLLLVQAKTISDHLATNWFGPVEDNDLISDDWTDVLIKRVQRTHFKTLVAAGSNEQLRLLEYSLADLKEKIIYDLFGKNADIILQQLPNLDDKKELVKAIGEAMYTYPAQRTAQLLYDNNADVYGNYCTVYEGQHGGNVIYLLTDPKDLAVDQRRNQKYYLQLLLDFIRNGKPYNDELKYEWPLFDKNQLVLKLDPNDISSVSMISKLWLQNLPWQTYKL